MRNVSLIFILSLVLGCTGDPIPKPRAYERVNLVASQFSSPNPSNWDCPYTCELSDHSRVTLDPRYRDSTCWYNIYYPDFRATIHLSYHRLMNNLAQQVEENRKLAMKHTAKASQINEMPVSNDSSHVYGIIYDFRGETASDMQFFLTDSITHFVRGALYFNVAPNKDSLLPVISFVKSDILHMVETWRWNQPASEED